MSMYAVSDLHLSSTCEKPMNIFGDNWEGHFEKIKKDWNEKVQDEDIVLIAGDISWAMKLSDGLVDIHLLQELKGKKVFIRGNHDYWWNGIGKIRQSAPMDFYFLQADAIRLDGYVILGSRGWICPESNEYKEETDKKLYLREVERFKLAFSMAKRLQQEGDKLIVMIHYPPFSGKKEDTLFTKMFEENKVDKVIFGHIHGSTFFPLVTNKNNIEYDLTSCDKLGFQLKKIF